MPPLPPPATEGEIVPVEELATARGRTLDNDAFDPTWHHEGFDPDRELELEDGD